MPGIQMNMSRRAMWDGEVMILHATAEEAASRVTPEDVY
jgi:hypothetical protein